MDAEAARYVTDDVTPQVAEAAKKLLDNDDLHVVIRTKLNTLGTDVLEAREGDELTEAHKEYWALRKFVEWIEFAATYGDKG